MVSYKTNYRILHFFLKQNHSNIPTLANVVSNICCFGVVATSEDNCIGRIGIRAKKNKTEA